MNMDMKHIKMNKDKMNKDKINTALSRQCFIIKRTTGGGNYYVKIIS